MTVPGFTAHASLYRTTGRYRTSGSELGASSPGGTLVPAYWPGPETQARCDGCADGCAQALAYCSLGPAATFLACGWWNPICTAAAAAAQGACNVASAACVAVCALTVCCPKPCGIPNPFEPGSGCCDEGEHCVDQSDPNSRHGCCPSQHSVCGGRCCARGESCCGDTCCPSNFFCVEGVCSEFPGPLLPPADQRPPAPTLDLSYCRAGWTPCLGQCCPPGLECCPPWGCMTSCLR